MLSNDFEKYGKFSDDGREFIITRMATPRPWINYAWSDNILVDIDQRGAGSNVYRDRDGNQSVGISNRFVYLKDRETKDFWTASWGIIKLPFEHYRCRHGLGYSTLECKNKHIVSQWTICASENSTEVWKLKVKNLDSRTRKIAIYPGVMFGLNGWTPYGSLENYTVATKLNSQTIFAQNRSVDRSRVRNNAFFASSFPFDHYDASLKSFLGSFYSNLENPQGIISEQLADREAMNEELSGIMQYNLNLLPNEEWECFFSTAPCFDSQDVEKLAADASEGEFKKACGYSKERTECFDRLDFKLPDPKLNCFFNIWGKQQLILLKDYARLFLIGFRDTLQDAASLCAYVPELAAKSILRTLAYQFNDGSALRGWSPIDEHKYADSGVWLAMAVAEYLKESGDYGFLDQKQIYRDGGDGTVWEHLCRSLEWFEDNLGKHDLPKLYFGDWNDSLNIGKGGKGQSVWLAMALVVAYSDAGEIAQEINKPKKAQEFFSKAQVMRENIEKVAWDGEWYLRGFTDSGAVVGGKSSPAGNIFSEPQSWAVMSGMNSQRLVKVAKAVKEKLQTPNGLMVCNPPFTHYLPEYGRISTFSPGWGENGSCYCHVTAFQAVADCLMRDGDSAFARLSSILPFNPALPIEISGLEPYAFSNMFRGPDNVRSGETFKGWTTGTVPWAMRCLTHYILGVRPDFDALIIDPVLPASWPSVSMNRIFRHAKIKIEINNPLALEASAAKTVIRLNGQEFSGNRIPVSMLTTGIHHITIELVAK